jgi:hypothetical protein
MRIEIPHNKTIGVVVSGGFDSSIMWHIIYGECLTRNQKCIPFTVPKVDGALTYATKMLEGSCNHYGTKQLHPIVVHADSVDWNRDEPYQGDEVAAQLMGGIREIILDGYADIVYTGVNAYPDNYETLCSYHIPGDRNLSRDSDAVHEGTLIKDIIRQPFADMTKDEIVTLAYSLGILEGISEVSHSCVEMIRGRCGECFWCKEREQGFAVAGHIDNGIN